MLLNLTGQSKERGVVSDEVMMDVECDEVIQVLQQIRETFRASSNAKTADLINHFWAFQDHLHRLVHTLANDPALCSLMDQKHPRLVTEMVDVLSFTSKTTVGTLAAIQYSCRAINELLCELQNLKYVAY